MAKYEQVNVVVLDREHTIGTCMINLAEAFDLTAQAFTLGRDALDYFNNVSGLPKVTIMDFARPLEEEEHRQRVQIYRTLQRRDYQGGWVFTAIHMEDPQIAPISREIGLEGQIPILDMYRTNAEDGIGPVFEMLSRGEQLTGLVGQLDAHKTT